MATETTLTQDAGARIAQLMNDLGRGSLSAQDGMIVLGAALILLVAMLAFWLLIRRRDPGPTPDRPLAELTRSGRRMGWVVALLFFGLFGGWAWYAPLSSAAIAPGVVSPDGARKTVQHLEGGIIRSIRVKEGDHVQAGDVLMTLEDVRAKARYTELHERLLFLIADEARLLAEESAAEAIDFPAELVDDPTEQAGVAMRSVFSLFENRRETQSARERILGKRGDQLREQITGLHEVIAAQDEQIALLDQELEATQTLYDQGLQRLPQLLALQRQLASLKAQRAENRASIARLDQQIGETELQLLATRQQGREEVSAELAKVRSELASLRAQLPERADALARTNVIAPISGMVMNVKVTTEQGGILRAGGDILDIVPEEAALIVDARVRPQDIDTVRPGMEARVLLTAYTQRNMPRIWGTVRSVSADRFTDERTGEPYFLARIYVDSETLTENAEDVELMSGMPADAMILTGERSFFDYLVKPLADSLRVSFRES